MKYQDCDSGLVAGTDVAHSRYAPRLVELEGVMTTRQWQPDEFILVINDIPALNAMYRQALLPLGYDIVVAASNQLAAAFMEHYKKLPRLILTNDSMLYSPGLEFYKRIQENPQWSHIPVVAVTESQQHANAIQRLVECGVDDFLLCEDLYKPGYVSQRISRAMQIL